jgi:DNA-binding transcriptional MerR regulator
MEDPGDTAEIDLREGGAAPTWRVGEAAAQVGVSASTLREWQRRYGIGSSTRTSGGHRLYSDSDIRRLVALRGLVARGQGVGRVSRLAAATDAMDVELLMAATRSVIHAQSVADVVECIVDFVRAQGADVAPASETDESSLPFDVSFGLGEPLVPVAPNPSVERLRLEHVLPGLVEDARRIVALLRGITTEGGAGAE